MPLIYSRLAPTARLAKIERSKLSAPGFATRKIRRDPVLPLFLRCANMARLPAWLKAAANGSRCRRFLRGDEGLQKQRFVWPSGELPIAPNRFGSQSSGNASLFSQIE